MKNKMPEKTKKNKKEIKVRDLKPKKDAKGGVMHQPGTGDIVDTRAKK
jgi:hypothetical protein